MNNRERLLEMGLDLFASRPYGTTGVREITQAVGVPTGSFHYYFKNKEEFALSVLAYFYQETLVNRFEEIVNNDKLSGKEKIIRIFRTRVQYYTKHPRKDGFTNSCVMGNLGQEVSAHTPAIAARLQEHIDSLLKAIAKLIEQGKKDGSVTSHYKSRQLAGFLFDAYEGALIRRKIYGTDQPVEDFLQSLQGIL